MAIKQAPFKPKDKKSVVDTVNTGLSFAKTAYSLGSDVNDALKGGTASTTGSAVDSTAWRNANLNVGIEDLDKYRRRLSGSKY